MDVTSKFFCFFKSTLLLCLIFNQSVKAFETARADSLYDAGRVAHLDSRLNESLSFYHQALEIYSQKEEFAKLANTKRYLVKVYWRLGKYDEALELAKAGLELAKYLDNQKISTTFLANMGTIRSRQGYYSLAHEHFTKALESANAIRDTTLIRDILHKFANLNTKMGNLNEAIRLHHNDLDLMKGSGDLKAEAITQNSIGVAYTGLGLFPQALKSFERSLKLREESSYKSDYAMVYTNIAKVHQKMGNYLLALDYYYKSLQRYQANDNKLYLAKTLGDIGSLYYDQNDYDRAEYYFLQSHLLSSEHGDPSRISENLKSLGNNYFKKGNISLAYSYMKDRLALSNKLGNKREIGDAFSDLGLFHQRRKEYRKALWHYEKAYDISQPIENKTLHLTYLLNIGSVYAKLDNYNLAYDNLMQAFEISKSINPNFIDLRIIIELANLYRVLKSDKSYYYAELFFETVERQRNLVGAVGRSKAGYFSNYATFYNQVASWYIEDNQLEKAFRWIEGVKFPAFIYDLAEASFNLDAKLNADQLDRKIRKLTKVVELTSKLELANAEDYPNVLEELRQAELDNDAFLSRLRYSNPIYSSFNYPKPVTITESRKKIGPNTVLLEYSLSDSKLVGLAINQKETKGWFIDFKEIYIKDKNYSLSELILNFREAVINKGSIAEINEWSHLLAQTLLGPAHDMLVKADKLMIVAEGMLVYLPFEALIWNNKYLVQDYQVKYIPSMTALSWIKDPKSNYPMDLLQVANPDFENTDKSAQGYSFMTLPYSTIEVNAIKPIFDRVTTLTGKDATELAIKNKNLNLYRYLHFATHGIVNYSNPDLSGLVLASTNQGRQQEDGYLRNSEISTLSMNSDFVVLSACETGLGSETRGEEALGLQKAFFLAGASTVIVSYWPVNDRSTSLLMTAFYKEINFFEKRNQSTIKFDWNGNKKFGYKAAAMRNAKLQLINSKSYNHPVYWAPFVVVGK
ncbi:MAG: CHAT domain-containing tetratricopeptide repeat protein [Balneolales bacterium]